ncbi:MAG TPA: hypothetical protein VFR05_02195, partial [Terriglobia bacterium]|nr:hypothetical protein [Terriglobia bacterium]
TNNDSVASLAAQFRVGQLVPNAGVFAGGGIFQTVVLDPGRVLLSVDIATSAEGINLSAGLFQLIFDGVVVAEHDFGMINANTSEFGVLSHVTDVTAGAHDFRIQMGRTFLSGCGRGCTPAQFVDNARITPVPETASFPILLTLGIAGLAAFRLSNL